MKPWNKPFRYHDGAGMKKYDQEENQNNKHYGVTNWMVGTCTKPWSPWVQIHFGYPSLQIKWYVIVIALMIVSFGIGLLF